MPGALDADCWTAAARPQQLIHAMDQREEGSRLQANPEPWHADAHVPPPLAPAPLRRSLFPLCGSYSRIPPSVVPAL